MTEKLVDLPHIDIDNLPLIDQERYYETELMIAPDFHRQAAALTELGIIHVRTGQYKRRGTSYGQQCMSGQALPTSAPSPLLQHTSSIHASITAML